MHGEPAISVAMATFNGEAYIEAQLRSWLVQLSPTDEIVISDDVSTDQTVDLIRNMGDQRIRIMSNTERVGHQRNFERAILATRGAIVFLSDQDDICLPIRVSQSVAALVDADLVFGDAMLVDSKLDVIQVSHFASRGVSRHNALSIWWRSVVIGATIAARRSFLLSALPLDAGLPHDQWLSLLAASQGRMRVIRAPLILYRRHHLTVTNTEMRSRRAWYVIATERIRLLLRLLKHRRQST